MDSDKKKILSTSSSDLHETMTKEKSKPEEKAMRGFELRRIVEVLLRPPNPVAAEEKTPIVREKHKLTENGTMTMDQSLSSSDIFRDTTGKGCKDESIESRKEDPPQNMSLLRKLCFFLSLNGGVMYIVVLAWLLPCRMFPCTISENKWTSNFTNTQFTMNMEMVGASKPSLVVFGYSDGSAERLGALTVSDGKLSWNNTLSATPNRVFCRINGKDINVNGNSGCIVTSDSFIAAFNAKNGNMIWERNITSEQRISKMARMQEINKRSYLIGISNEYLHLIDSGNGTEVLVTSLPCSWSVDVKIAGPWLSKGGYVWSLVCEYGDGLEVFTFKEKELLNFSKNGDEANSLGVDIFKSLFSKQSYGGSIDLAGDVTATPHSLVLSWADMVVMVTAHATSHHLHKTWERHFSNSTEYAVDVTGIVVGHFKDSKSIQVAVAVNRNSNSRIHVLETRNGSSIAVMELSSRTVLSLRKIPGANEEKDNILIESIQAGNSSIGNYRNGPMTRTYSILKYENNTAILQDITTAEDVFDSNLSTISEGISNLLLASTKDGNSIINRLVVKNHNLESSWCNNEKSKNASAVTFME